MSELAISLIAFVLIVGGMICGMVIRSFLPEHHLSEESKDAVKLGVGTIATMAALVLGLLIASAKSTFDAMNNGIRELSSRVILLDRVMAHYGPEMKEARALLRLGVVSAIQRRWPEDQIAPETGKASEEWVGVEIIQDKLRQLCPQTEAHRLLLERAWQVSGEIAEARWLLVAQVGSRSIPMPFLGILIGWLALIFTSFGLLSPRNLTVITILFVCAVSTAGALFLILEMDAPYEGLLKISSAPLHTALTYLSR
ncbi:MAG: hypothetical protein WHT07_07440 [Desulfobaccales bacterium]